MTTQPDFTGKTIVLAGATGALGLLIAQHLVWLGATVTALIRKNADGDALAKLKKTGTVNIIVDYNDAAALQKAVAGASCVVSALSGLEEVIVTAQTQLLNAAVAAGVPRFIPSDFCIDYTKLPAGGNRNLDLRRQFAAVLDAAPIKATAILNGMFMDMLKGQAPMILFKQKRIFYWGNANQPMDFTTMDDTAAYTAHAALDDAAPRYLRVAGEVATAKDLQRIAAAVTDTQFGLLRPGGLGAFRLVIKLTRFLHPQKGEVFPIWQGMQYMYDMFTGMPKLAPLDNDRYKEIHWTTIKELLSVAKD